MLLDKLQLYDRNVIMTLAKTIGLHHRLIPVSNIEKATQRIISKIEHRTYLTDQFYSRNTHYS